MEHATQQNTQNGLGSQLTSLQPAGKTTNGLSKWAVNQIQSELAAGNGVNVSILLNEKNLTDNDGAVKQQMLELLGTAYRLDYFDTNSVHFHAARDLFRRAVKKGWTANEFLERLDVMTETCKYPTWTPADFFGAELPKLYPYSWVMKEVHNDRNAMSRMESYRIPGFEKSLWRYYNGTTLPFALVYRCGIYYEEPPKPVLKPLEPATPLVQMFMKLKMKFLRIEQENKRLQRAVKKYCDRILELEQENQHLRDAYDAEPEINPEEVEALP